MIKKHSRLWHLFHPIQSHRLRKENAAIIAKLKVAAMEVCADLDAQEQAGAFDKLSTRKKLAHFQRELQSAFYKVLESKPSERTENKE